MKNYLVLACLVVTSISCSTDDNTIPEPEENFYALTVGNSWVYEHHRRENIQSIIFNNTGVIDSVKIVGTEIINDNEFYKYRIRTSGNENNIAFCSPNGERFEYVRDSIGYLIDEYGKVKFSREDDQEFLLREDSFLNLYTARGENNEIISTTAGDFDCEYMKIYAKQPQTLELFPALDKYHFAEGVGKVFNTVSFSSEDIHRMERRLISYNVQ
ncbi:hypothetical protein IMCC3317_19650 [Kordia antarctica]|uniref:Lipoprotein n=1 Tax=Kordia antarctica TaxID=1218801 RepID=A0A7L4ZIY9_9FLAO|nr:hypothetical protein [Kordia antarctica]QHI36602.1 hypothetical protein IMCC3317_19650 [Kordia antarctica]